MKNRYVIICKRWAIYRSCCTSHLLSTSKSRDRCYGFKNIFAKKFGDKIGGFLLELLLVFAKI
jgi:hypothetical protein